MNSFRLLIDYEVVLFIESLSKPARKSIRARLGEIRDFPAQRSDFSEHDAMGRSVQINICGAFAIKY